MKRRMIVYICTLILVCMFFKTIPTVAKENTDAINIEKMSENISEKQVRSTIVGSGECGENATWKLDSTGTLTISGTGEMYDYRTPISANLWSGSKMVPWMRDYNGLIKRIVVEEGITKIGDGTFVWAGAEPDNNVVGEVESITLPSTLKSIGYEAFFMVACPYLYIPDRVETIHGEAFMAAKIAEISVGTANITKQAFTSSGVSKVILRNGVTTIGEYAFDGCKNLKELTFPQSLKIIGRSAFFGCTAIETITIPDSVTQIDPDAFYGCTSLKTAVIRAKIETIGQECFRDCSSLSSVSLTGSLKGIAYGTFQGCSSLVNVDMPEEITYIGAGAFYNCTSLKSIRIPQKVQDIYSQAFGNCLSLTSVDIPASVNNIVLGVGGKLNNFSAFNECENLKSITVNPANQVYKSYDGCIYNANKTELLYCPLGKTEVMIPDTVVSIPNYAFYTTNQNEHLKNIYFYGKAPEIPDDGMQCVTANVYYPEDNNSWNTETKKNYEGNLNWTGWQPDISKYNVTLWQSDFVYDGAEKRPMVLLKYGTKILEEEAYNVVYENNTNAGIAHVKITGVGKYKGTATERFVINKAKQNIRINLAKNTIEIGETLQISAEGIGQIQYLSDNTNVASVSSTGSINAKNTGRAVIQITAYGNENYEPQTESIVINVISKDDNKNNTEETDKSDNGANKDNQETDHNKGEMADSNSKKNETETNSNFQQTIVKTTQKITLNRKKLTLKKGKSFKLKVTITPKDSQNKIFYKTSNKKIVTVSKNGKIKAKKKGTAKITVISGKKKAVCKVKVK